MVLEAGNPNLVTQMTSRDHQGPTETLSPAPSNSGGCQHSDFWLHYLVGRYLHSNTSGPFLSLLRTLVMALRACLLSLQSSHLKHLPFITSGKMLTRDMTATGSRN